jgi:FkbM family methyltransferase
MELSYTQNLEDYHLALAFADQPSGFYVDVGAGHPVADSVSYWFYLRGWAGVIVEPQDELASLQRRIRPRDTVVQSLIGRTSGYTNFYQVDRLHGLSTTVESNARSAGSFGATYRTVSLPCMTLSELCARYANREIDFLVVDVEGAEADVIRGNDFSKYRPKVMVVESDTLTAENATWPEWEQLLIEQDYEFVLFDTLNRFYVAKEQTGILARFPRERAPWDAVRHMYEIGRAPENASHPDHGLALELATGFWASLPELDPTLVSHLILRGRLGRRPSADEITSLAQTLDTDLYRAALGRIACGYDGGQVT